jgi:hypothetical protein
MGSKDERTIDIGGLILSVFVGIAVGAALVFLVFGDAGRSLSASAIAYLFTKLGD